jgi:membrane AbrB-like protein
VTLIPTSMASAIPSRAIVLNAVETLAVGSAGGLLFLWANLPGGLISGAMIAVGIAALAGRPLAVPPILTQSVLVLLGISLGSLVSRQLIQHMSAYPLTIGLLALATFCSTFGSSHYLQRFHGWDKTAALLAGSPGALSQITVLAAEKGADVAAIAVVQTIRVIILTAALPMILALTGIAPSAPPVAVTAIASPIELVGLIAASVAVALLLRLMNFPASWMFGAMIGSSLLHGMGLAEGGLPPWMRGVALSRPVARRIQCADLAADGGNRWVGLCRCPTGKSLKPVQSVSEKYSASPVGQIISTSSRHPPPLKEGRLTREDATSRLQRRPVNLRKESFQMRYHKFAPDGRSSVIALWQGE